LYYVFPLIPHKIHVRIISLDLL